MKRNRSVGTWWATLLVFIMLAMAPGLWAGGVYKVLYNFKGGSDGANPYGSVILDTNGNLYGTAAYGGAYGAGVVFEITP